MRNQRTALIALLLIALALRLIWVVSFDASDASLRSLPDQVEYLSLARNLLNGSGLKFHDDRLDADVFAFRTPGYPLFVAAMGANIRTVRIAQALIDTSTVLAVYVLARRWLSPRASLFAALIIAINPFLIYFAGPILSETLFVALLVWGMALLTHLPDRASWVGLLPLALSVVVRPSAIALPVLLAMTAGIRPQAAIARGVFAASIVLVVLFPWALRNNRALGRWIWTTTNTGFTLYDGFNPQATGASDQRFVTRMSEQLRNLPDEVARSRYLSSEAMRFIREQPMKAMQLTRAKIARMWSPVPLSHEFGSRLILTVVAAAYTIPLFVLVAIGLWRRTPNLPAAAKVFLLLPAIYFTVVHAFSVGSLRYRIPADVPMAVIAGAVLGKSEIRNPKSETNSNDSNSNV